MKAIDKRDVADEAAHQLQNTLEFVRTTPGFAKLVKKIYTAIDEADKLQAKYHEVAAEKNQL